MNLPRTTLLLLLATAAAASRADERFDALRRGAQPLEDLAPFLERYLGRCADGVPDSDCERKARELRRKLQGHVFAVSVAEQTLEIVKVERARGGYRFLVTPFIDGGGIALTHGQPRRQDAAGRPLIGLLAMEGALPAGMDETDLERALRLGRLELQVVFRPEGTWRLKRGRGARSYEGVRSRFLGLRLVESRTGAEIASRVY